MDEYLWPARHVAEYAYCPRLFYLMEVEGVYYPSADTEKGKAVHKRVDKTSAANNGRGTDADGDDLPPDPDKPKSVRSLALTSQKLGLTATLDIAEINGSVAVPVEYRKGRPQYISAPPPPDDPGESASNSVPPPAAPWPTDRVQAGLHAILLEEAGYQVPNVTLYYAAERRRIELPVIDDLRQRRWPPCKRPAPAPMVRGPHPWSMMPNARAAHCNRSVFPMKLILNAPMPSARGSSGHRGMTPFTLWPSEKACISACAACRCA